MSGDPGGRTGAQAGRRPAVFAAVSVIAVVLLFAARGVGAQTPPSSTTTSTAVPESTTASSVAPTTAPPQSTTTSSDPTTTTSTATTSTSEAPSTTSVPVQGDNFGSVPGESPTTTMPTGPPPGFTEEQFKTFVGVVSACGSDPGVICSHVLAWTHNRALAEATQWISDVPIRVLIIVAIALVSNWLVRRGIARYIDRVERRAAMGRAEDPALAARGALRVSTASTTLASAASVAIFVAALILSLAQFNVSVGPLLASAGIVGVALGFGAQNLVRDVLAGLFVLVEDQYGIGDTIDTGRASGVVEGISLRVTKLRDVEGTLWFVPNGTVSEVANLTQRWARVILDVRVPYGVDHHEAGRLIKETADELWRADDAGMLVLSEPELWGVEELGESALLLRVAVTCAATDQWAVARELRGRIKDRFDSEGISMPFPQRTVWLREGRGPSEAADNDANNANDGEVSDDGDESAAVHS